MYYFLQEIFLSLGQFLNLNFLDLLEWIFTIRKAFRWKCTGKQAESLRTGYCRHVGDGEDTFRENDLRNVFPWTWVPVVNKKQVCHFHFNKDNIQLFCY